MAALPTTRHALSDALGESDEDPAGGERLGRWPPASAVAPDPPGLDLERSLPFCIELLGFKSLTPIPQGPAQFVSLSTEGGKLGVGGRRH